MSRESLDSWLAPLSAAGAAISLRWGRGQHQLVRRTYATPIEPPDALVSSVRAVVFRRGAVAVLRDPDGSLHVIPGGRRETGEAQMQTLVREIAEETGWRFADATRFGFLHFRHLTPKPNDYPYPYPDFFQTLYSVEAADHDRRRIVRDGWETHSRLTPIARALDIVTDDQKPILRLAVAARGG